MTDLVVHQPTDTLSEQMRYAETVSRAALLPAAYRGKPADILIATGLGNAIGIPPAQALYEIYVVNGRPSPSANLMAALARRAGHKLRVNGDHRSCTATLIRHDDPEAPFTATWTMEQANAAKLTGKDTWKQYPSAMLRARAIAEVVRMGAPEAVLGMEYAREEVQDIRPEPTSAPINLTAFTEPAPAPQQDDPLDEFTDKGHDPVTDAQLKKLHTAFSAAGITERDDRLAYVNRLIERDVESSKVLSKSEASQVIDALESAATEPALPIGDES